VWVEPLLKFRHELAICGVIFLSDTGNHFAPDETVNSGVFVGQRTSEHVPLAAYFHPEFRRHFHVVSFVDREHEIRREK
jgi:hypothetical protein